MHRLVAPRGVAGYLSIAITTAVGLSSRAAVAQGADAAMAEALFQQGRQLLRAGKAAQACPKLAESQRIDPSTGTLLALALCHEAEGKLASAWAAFVSVEARARDQNRPDREQAAREHAQALRPRLSTLEVQVPAEVAALPGVVVRRDGALLGRGGWNVAVPVDGAEHVVEVNATGKAPWRGSVSVKAESDAAVLTVPLLAAAKKAAKAIESTSVARDARESDGPRSEDGRWGSLEWIGMGTAGAGVLGLGVGGYFLGQALGKKSDSNKDCDGDLCGPEGAAARRTAVTHGNRATLFAIAGGVLAGGGATLFMVGRLRAGGSEGAAAKGTGVAISAGPAGVGAQFSTYFF